MRTRPGSCTRSQRHMRGTAIASMPFNTPARRGAARRSASKMNCWLSSRETFVFWNWTNEGGPARHSLAEFDFDLSLAAVADDDEFQFARTFLIEQPIDVRGRFDRFAAHRDDAIAGFQSGPLTQLSGPHFGNKHAVLGGVEEFGQLPGQRGHAHADLTEIGGVVVTGAARRLAFRNLAVTYLPFNVSAALSGQLAEHPLFVEEAARLFFVAFSPRLFSQLTALRGRR